MCDAGWHGEGGRVSQDLGAAGAEGEGGFWKPQIKADEQSHLPQFCVKGVLDPRSLFDRVRFFKDRPVFDFDVEEVEFLITLCDFAVFVNPEECVFYFFAVGGGFVDADVYGQFMFTSRRLEAKDEGGSCYGLAEGDCAFGVTGYALKEVYNQYRSSKPYIQSREIIQTLQQAVDQVQKDYLLVRCFGEEES